MSNTDIPGVSGSGSPDPSFAGGTADSASTLDEFEPAPAQPQAAAEHSEVEHGPPDAEEVRAIAATAERIRSAIHRAVVGQREVVEQVLIALLAGGHVLVEGVPGLGKTLLARALAQSFGGSFSRIQFTPDLMPTDVTGHVMFDMKTEAFRVRRGPVFANLLLADEINRAPAKTQSALLEVMQEQQVSIEGKAMPVPLPFMTIATQNPIEQEGTYPLPEAQIDRFLLLVRIDYPPQDEERALVRAVTDARVGDRLDVSSVEQVLGPEALARAQGMAARVQVDDSVHAYLVDITRRTREWPGVRVGAGPRGAIALVRAARAAALLDGRDFVTPDDIRAVTLPVLRHRIILAPEAELEGKHEDDTLREILAAVQAPRS